MKQLKLILTVAVAAIICSCNATGNTGTVQPAGNGAAVAAPQGSIVYIQLDSLVSQYDMFNDLRSELESKAQAIQDDLTKKFVSAYQAKYNEIPNQFAADAYDAIYIIKAAIEKSGATPDMSISDMCNAIKGAMTQISINGVTGLNMTWTADGEPNKAPKGMVIKNGAYVAM